MSKPDFGTDVGQYFNDVAKKPNETLPKEAPWVLGSVVAAWSLIDFGFTATVLAAAAATRPVRSRVGAFIFDSKPKP